MLPVLFDETLVNPNKLGKGKLYGVTSCIVHEELNGEYTLTLKYPITGVAYSELMAGGGVQAVCPHYDQMGRQSYARAREMFDITKHSLPIDGLVTFTCQHVSRRLSRSVYTGTTLTADSWGQAVTLSQPADWGGISLYGFNTSSGLAGSIALDAPKSSLACLLGSENSLASEFGYEFMWASDLGFGDGNTTLAGYIAQKRGEDRGAYIRFGVNMLDINHEKDTTNAFNAYVPFWDDGAGNITYATGYIVQPSTPISPVVAVPLDCSNAFDSQPTSAQFVTYARDLLDSQMPWSGEETLHVDFVNGVEIDPHGADIQLGDTVHVYWEAAGITADLRVVAYDYDVLAERYISMELGTQQTQYVAVTGESYAGTSGGSSYPPNVVAGTFTKTDNSTTLGGNTGIWHDGHIAQLVIGANRTGSSYPANTYTQIATIDPKPRTDISTVVTSPNGVATMIFVATSGNVSIYPYNNAAISWIRAVITFFI